MKGSCRGTALLAVVILLAFLALSAGLLQRRVFRIAQLRKEEKVGGELDEREWRAAPSLIEPDNKRPSLCSEDPDRGSVICVRRNLFPGRSAYPGIITPEQGFAPSKLPLWSPRVFHGDTLRCPGATSVDFREKHAGLVSSRICDALPVRDAPFIVEGNVAAKGAVSIVSKDLAVTGALDLEGMSITSPAWVFAGGSIRIGTLQAEAPVLLISATGDVEVHAVTQPGLVSVISPRTARLPAGAEAAALPQALPPTERFLILGRHEN